MFHGYTKWNVSMQCHVIVIHIGPFYTSISMPYFLLIFVFKISRFLKETHMIGRSQKHIEQNHNIFDEHGIDMEMQSTCISTLFAMHCLHITLAYMEKLHGGENTSYLQMISLATALGKDEINTLLFIFSSTNERIYQDLVYNQIGQYFI